MRIASSRIACICLVASCSIANAAAISPFGDKPASSRSLPADNLPPFDMLDEHGQLTPPPPMPPQALNRGPGAQLESTAPGPRLSLALIAARAALERCASAGFRVGVAVIDSVGEARVMLTADGADGSHVFVATRKAITALAFGMSSADARQRILENPSLLARVQPNMFVAGGAVPLQAGGRIIGAIGVSGAAGVPIGHQDEVCAEAGMEKIRGRLE